MIASFLAVVLVLYFLAATCTGSTAADLQAAIPTCTGQEMESCALFAARQSSALVASHEETAACILADVLTPPVAANTSTCSNVSLVCDRRMWRSFATCLAQNVKACVPFSAEEHCLRASYPEECGGSLAGICGEFFAFPKRNCSNMPLEFFGKPCPVMSSVYLCEQCATSQFYLPLFYAIEQGVKGANPFNKVVMFEMIPYELTSNMTGFMHDMRALVDSLDNCQVMFSFSGFFVYENLTASYPDMFFIVIQNTELRTDVITDRFLYVLGRADLAMWVGAKTLAAQSPDASFLFSSSTLDGLRQEFFMGMATAALSSGNATVILAPSYADAQIAFDTFTSPPNVMGLVSVDVYMFAQRSFTFGVVNDFQNDPRSFKGVNNSQSQHILGSVLIDLTGTYRSAAAAAARGDFLSGIAAVDTSTMTRVPCKYSCYQYGPNTLRAFNSAFRDILDPRMDLGVAYSFFERSLPQRSNSFAPLVDVTGADVLLLDPQLLLLADKKTLFVLNLMNRAGCCGFVSMAIAHLQLQQQPNACDNALAGRAHYASAIDSSSQVVYVIGGLWSNGNASSRDEQFMPMSDVWSASVYVFAARVAWSVLQTSGLTPPPRFGHACAIVDGVMYVFGGRVLSGNVSGPLPADPLAGFSDIGRLDENIYALNLSNRLWAALPPCPSGGRAFHTALVLGSTADGDAVIVFSGGDASVGGPSTVAFDVASRSWIAQKDIPTPFLQPAVADALRGVARPCMAGVTSSTVFVATPALCLALSISAGVYESLPSCTLPTAVMSCSPFANGQLVASGQWGIIGLAPGHLRSGSAAQVLLPIFPSCDVEANEYTSPSLLACRKCPEGSYTIGYECAPCGIDDEDGDVDIAREHCPASSNSSSRLIIAVSLAAFFAVAIAVVVRVVYARRRLRLLLNSDRVAEQLADCMEKLDFSQLDFLSTSIETPTRLQQAFLDIRDVLSRLVTFLPVWVLDMDRTEDDDAVEQTAGSPTIPSSSDWAQSDYGVSMSATSRSTYNRYEQLSLKPKLLLGSNDMGQHRMFHCSVTLLAVFLKTTKVDVPQYGRALECVMMLSRRNRGSLDHMVGNSGFVTFNGLRKNDNAYDAAIKAVSEITLAVGESCPDMHVCFSVCKGYATVGLIGWRYGRHTAVLGSNIGMRAERLRSVGSILHPRESSCAVAASDLDVELQKRYAFRLEGLADISGDGSSNELFASMLGVRRHLPRPTIFSMDARNRIIRLLSRSRINEAIAAFQRASPRMLAEDKEYVSAAIAFGGVPIRCLGF